jgi:nitrogen fixation/metabolism regulation signal transduction histidine kinase
MSDEIPNDHDLHSGTGGAGFRPDAFIPLVILSISFIVLLGWQVNEASAQRTLLENALTRSQAAVTQAQQVQGTVSKLASDLLEAAQTDDTAKAIVNKYNIKQNGATGDAPAAASPSPAAASPSP